MKDKVKFEECEYKIETPLFTKEMKKEYTILSPDIFPVHMDLITRVFRLYGYNLEVLHYEGKSVIEASLESIHNDMCYPVICMTGQFITTLKSGKYDPHKVAFVMFQTGGGCRASNYIWIIRKALDRLGYSYVPVLSLSFNSIEKNPGFKLTPPLLFKGIMAILYGDILMLLSNQIRPYEKNKGETNKKKEEWNNRLIEEFKRNKGLLGSGFEKNLRAICDDFASIEKTGEKKTKVGIVGEIYVKYAPLGNNHLQDFLEKEGCEVMVPGLLSFFLFMFDNRIGANKTYGIKRHTRLSKLGLMVSKKVEGLMHRVLSDYPMFKKPLSYSEQKKIAEPIISTNCVMGEGWLLPAETAELITLGYTNIVCAQPFGCLPNHIVGKGVIRRLRELYPSSNICPIDYDSSQSTVNQENRIKLMLSMAREN